MVKDGDIITYGKLFYAEIKTFENLPNFEIVERKLVDDILKEALAYPVIQPVLIKKVKEYLYDKRSKDGNLSGPAFKLGSPNIPKHVAIITDGNGRWAVQRGMSRSLGHKAGVEQIGDITQACLEASVKILTWYVFSTENWSRD